MGVWLKSMHWLPDEVLCSTATRTRQTLDLLGLPNVSTRFERSLYLAEAEEIVDALRAATGDTVLLLSHNHGIAECAKRLLEDWPNHPRFNDYPTCATSLIQFEIDDWSKLAFGSGTCVDFAIPREVITSDD